MTILPINPDSWKCFFFRNWKSSLLSIPNLCQLIYRWMNLFCCQYFAPASIVMWTLWCGLSSFEYAFVHVHVNNFLVLSASVGKDKIPVLVSTREYNFGEESIFIFDPLFKLVNFYFKNDCREPARVQQKLQQRRHQKRISRSCLKDNWIILLINGNGMVAYSLNYFRTKQWRSPVGLHRLSEYFTFTLNLWRL